MSNERENILSDFSWIQLVFDLPSFPLNDQKCPSENKGNNEMKPNPCQKSTEIH